MASVSLPKTDSQRETVGKKTDKLQISSSGWKSILYWTRSSLSRNIDSA